MLLSEANYNHSDIINRLELAFSGLQQLLSRYQSSHDLSKVQLLQLELLLENGQVQESCRVVEQCITGNECVVCMVHVYHNI